MTNEEETNKITIKDDSMAVVLEGEENGMDTFFDSYRYDDDVVHLYKRGELIGHIYDPTKEILGRILDIGIPERKFEKGETE